MSRGHLISEKSAGNAKPVTSLDSGTSPRFRLKAVEYLGFVCVCICACGWTGRVGGQWNFYFPFLCGFQTQSTTPLSQLKLSISQRPKGESWLLAKAAQGRGWNAWSMARYFLSHSFSVGIVVTDSSNFFFFPILLFLLVMHG